ncbi:MAG: DUF5666 domain-containing protein [Deltaproteobacteria bacterium]|nr:DUF5666 domain-containing protein [Deltaproteobacteria bacterium]
MIRNRTMVSKVWWALPFVLGIGLAACGGGGAGTGTTTTRGPITGFGSVFVNGIEFQTGAQTHRRMLDEGPGDAPGHDNEVFRVGMVVTVHHGPDDDNATEIEYEDNLEGPVESVNAVDNSFQALGQKVVYDNTTHFEFSGDATLSPGAIVEVSGLPDVNGVIHATYIEVMPAGSRTTFEIKGFLGGLPTADNTFRLGPSSGVGTVTVDYMGAMMEDMPAGGLANGLFVEIETNAPATGTFPNAVIRATKVDMENEIGQSGDHHSGS